MDDAIRYAEAARDALEGFPDNDYKRALLWVPSFVVGREK
jgi:octaprenyl-diphosphate synthase